MFAIAHRAFSPTLNRRLERGASHRSAKDFSGFHNMDFFKLTAMYVRSNNNIVLWLALTEVALVNFFGLLRRISKLRVAATLYFGVMALASPIIFFISGSYAGF